MKKYNSKLILLALMTVFILGTGCKKYLDVNDDPNNPETVTPAVQLTASQVLAGYSIGGDMARYTCMIDHQITGNDRQFVVLQGYSYVATDYDILWGNIYQAMTNFYDMYTKAEAKGDYPYAGIAKVMQAYSLGMVTSMWGDVPFSKAFQAGITGDIKPAYDSQQKVYEEIQTLLDGAISDFSKTPTQGSVAPGVDDLVYGGDLAKWTELAHGLKARYYLHIRKIDNSAIAKAKSELANALTNGDDALITFGATPTNANPWWQFQSTRGGYITYLDSKALDLMLANSDPRLNALIDTANDNIGLYYGDLASPVAILSYAEQKAIEAELDLVTNDSAGAASAHNAGVIASVTTVTGAAPDTAWVTANASETSLTITLEKIINMKYIALYSNPEAYTDWRRTGYPTISPAAGSQIPRAFLYSESEIERNPQSVQGTRSLYSHLWWDN